MGAGRETLSQVDDTELLWFIHCRLKSHYQNLGLQVALPEAMGRVACRRPFGHWSLLSKGLCLLSASAPIRDVATGSHRGVPPSSENISARLLEVEPPKAMN